MIICLVYLINQHESISNQGENLLIRHQNLIAISYFYIIAYFVVMATGISAIQTHPVHDILYNTIPMIYITILLFAFSVSPKNTHFIVERDETRENMESLPRG